MGSNWEAIGFFRWPMSFCLLLVLFLWLRSAISLYGGSGKAVPTTKAWLDGVLAWGFLAFLNGILGSVTGIILALQSIEAAGGFRGTLVAPGIKMTLLSMFFGTAVCGVAVLLWYTVHLRWHRLNGAGSS
jgi:hypothetical protein